MSQANASPTIEWDFGSAYELFASLHVLHHPDQFGLRPSWAAGVRSRIPPAERKFLEEMYPILGVPLQWIHDLPAPKDAISALWALKQIPPAQRMIHLQKLDKPAHPGKTEEETAKIKQFHETLLRITAERAWMPEDADFFLKIFRHKNEGVKREAIERALDWWSRPEEMGEIMLSAMQAYHQAFFAEEEKRITPYLRAGLEKAQALASRLPLNELFLELSQGVQLGEEFTASKFVFAPAFWTTPLIYFEKLDADTQLIVFGTRPANVSAVPGETIPDGLVRSLKALADPTRLKILFYLSRESLTPSELARKLQLRAPTVIHHLNDLRLASMVELSMEHGEKRYAIRKQALGATFDNLSAFLKGSSEE
jgi:DNA-binding transcriptional ArsR family regulator